MSLILHDLNAVYFVKDLIELPTIYQHSHPILIPKNVNEKPKLKEKNKKLKKIKC